MQEAIKSAAAELRHHKDKFASAANLYYPKMFDESLTAAIQTG